MFGGYQGGGVPDWRAGASILIYFVGAVLFCFVVGVTADTIWTFTAHLLGLD
jgi:hypothetical protein